MDNNLLTLKLNKKINAFIRKQSTLNVSNNNSEPVIHRSLVHHLISIDMKHASLDFDSAASGSFIFSNLLPCVTKSLAKGLIPSLVSTVQAEANASFPTGDDAAN